MKVLAIAGSLRASSSNLAMLHAAGALAPEGLEITIYGGLGDLPHFNPDRDIDPPPPEITDLRRQMAAAAGVIFSTPEYVHGLPGSLKNLLDWLVSSGEIGGKPILIINAAPAGADRAQAALVETLTVMEGQVLASSLLVPFVRRKLTGHGEGLDPEPRAALRQSLADLHRAMG